MHVPITVMSDLAARGWDVTPTSEVTIELIPGAGVTGPTCAVAEGPLRTLPGAESTSGPEADSRIALEARYDEQAGCYAAHKLSVAAPSGTEVTGTLLREITPLRIMRWVLPRSFTVDTAASPYIGRFIAPELAAGDLREMPTPTLQDAAVIYQLASIVREPPAKAVADTLGLQTRTATNWIVRAKQQGILQD